LYYFYCDVVAENAAVIFLETNCCIIEFGMICGRNEDAFIAIRSWLMV
jgi:hypothetical protein